MKRLSAIFFLLVLVFNFYGYRMAISYIEAGSERAMELKMDNSYYSATDLLSIKTKLNLPYYSSSGHFERAYGSITVNGVVYEYVQKRVYQDTLELLCLPNTVKTKAQEVKNELNGSAAEGQASLPVKKGSASIKITLPEFCLQGDLADAVSALIQRRYSLHNSVFFFADFTPQQERPPQAASSFFPC